jgi:hypothetical protein
VLASARANLQRTPCPVLNFADVPDAVGGAYLFRNGFLEALAGDGVPPARAAIISTGAGECTVHWRDGEFR